MVHSLWLTNQHSSLTAPLTTAYTSPRFLYFLSNFIFFVLKSHWFFTLFLSCHVSGVHICLWQFHGPVWLWLTLAAVRNTSEIYRRTPGWSAKLSPDTAGFSWFWGGRKTSRSKCCSHHLLRFLIMTRFFPFILVTCWEWLVSVTLQNYVTTIPSTPDSSEGTQPTQLMTVEEECGDRSLHL